MYEPTAEQIEAACAAIRRRWDEQTEIARRNHAPSFIHSGAYDDLVWCRCGEFLGWICWEFVGNRLARRRVQTFKNAKGVEASLVRTCQACRDGRDTSLLNIGHERHLDNDWHEQNTCDQPPWWEQIANEE